MKDPLINSLAYTLVTEGYFFYCLAVMPLMWSAGWIAGRFVPHYAGSFMLLSTAVFLGQTFVIMSIMMYFLS